MKIFVDTKPLRTGHAVRGVGSYTRNLIETLKKRGGVKLVNSPRLADVVHIPYFDLFFNTLEVSGKPTVVTIYDVIPLIYSEHYPPGIRGKINFWRQKWELKKVNAVITISETSKKDIVRFLDVPQQKIRVSHLAPGKMFKPITSHSSLITARKKYNLPDSFVLYVGDVNYNKNVLRLVKACKKIGVPLVIIGKQAAEKDFDRAHIENEPLLHLIEEYGDDPDVVRLGFVSEEDLVKIYNLATVYCQPSLYEGFGLPVLEAMACGTPVAAAKTQALVEIAEGAALFVDPKDTEDISHELKKVLTNKKLQEELSAKGLKHVQNFSWEKHADETLRVYKYIMTND